MHLQVAAEIDCQRGFFGWRRGERGIRKGIALVGGGKLVKWRGGKRGGGRQLEKERRLRGKDLRKGKTGGGQLEWEDLRSGKMGGGELANMEWEHLRSGNMGEGELAEEDYN